jgi:AraC-like DNA-binding protein
MPAARSGSFSEPHQFQEWIRPARTAIVPTALGRFAASLSFLALPDVTVQRGSQALPIAVRSEAHSARYTMMFNDTAAGSDFGVNGLDVSAGVFALARPAAVNFLRVPAGCDWATLTLTGERFGALLSAVTEKPFGMDLGTSIVRPDPDAFARLRARHRAALDIMTAPPHVAGHPEAARAAEQAILAALTDCLAAHPDIVDPEAENHPRTVTLRRFFELLENSDGEPLYVVEACNRLGVSVRTLHTACIEHTGLSPHRFLSLRRLHLARRALLKATPHSATVTGIAADFGFWELGRFSVRYRQVFGESPSATLARPTN